MKKFLSIVLSILMIVTMLPMAVLPASAASEAITLKKNSYTKVDYSNNATQYYQYNNYLYKVAYSNLKNISKVAISYDSADYLKLHYTKSDTGDTGYFFLVTSYQGSSAKLSNLPTASGKSVSFYTPYADTYASNEKNPVVTVTCMAVNEPVWSWGDSSATAAFTSTDGGATMTVDAAIESSEQTAATCLENDKTTYTATATANGKAYTNEKTVDGEQGPHSFEYSGDDVIGRCTNGCGYECPHENQTGSACEICGAELHVCSNYNNGFCTECDAYEPATLVTNENYESFYLKADYVGYYAISNAGQLFWYANYINTVDRTANAVLTADIDLENRPWTPIGATGENSNNFRGIFDGQKRIIEGLYVEGDRAGLGFFGEVRTGTVKNFTIFGEVVVNTEVDYVGGVIGSICGVNGENDLERNGAIIQNINSYVNLTVKAHGVGKIGGFVGYANHQSLIEKCSWYGTFDAGEYRVDSGAGGFIGKIQENTSEVTIRNCAAYGTIKTNYAGDYNDTATIYMGGFLSFSNTNAKTTLENCLFAGRFERGENLTDEAFLGAFGTLRSVNAIKNCYYLGDDGLEAVHSDSDLKPGSDNVEITSVTGEDLRGEMRVVWHMLGEYWTQGIHYPILKEGQTWHGDSATYTYTDNGDGTHKKTCNECGYVEEVNEEHYVDPTTTYTDNGNGTHSFKCAKCDADVAKVPHTLDVTTGKCSACGTDMTAIATVTDSTNTYYAADAATLNQAVTAILETGSRTFTVELPADTEAEMITAIRRAICDTEGVADGSINLTLKGVTSIPGTTNWDGVAFGPGDIYDEAGEIVDQELVTQLASVNLPDATEIGAQAFYFCENLVSVSAPKAQTIGAQAFGYTALTSVEFPELTTIPTDMFSGTWTLSSAKFPKVTTIEQNGLLIGAKFNPENNPTPFPLELTAEGDITFIGSNHFNIASQNYSGKVDLVLNIDKKDQVTFNDDGTATWQVRDDLSYTFKSITFTCTDGTTNHSYTYTDNGDGTHDKVCTGCGYVEVDNEAHSGGTATCTEQAKCEHCGASYGEVDKNNHDETVAYVNGFCPNCDAYEPAKLVNGVYEISNAGNLYWFADKVTNENAAYGSADAILTCDIRVNEGTMTEASTGARVWTPIGKHGFGVNIPYTGTFEGNGKTVSGLYFNDTSANFSVGLFSLVGEGGKVQNVGIADSYLCGSQNIGAVAGSNRGTVTGCYNTGTVSGTTYVGGVVGACIGEAILVGCYNTGTVSGTKNVGGVAGSNFGTVTGCYNTGTVIGSSYVGGVVCANDGTVTGCYNTGIVSGSKYVGGVVGDSDGIVTNCYFDSTVYTGDAIGNNYGTATNVEGKSTEQFASGEVAYLLSQGENGSIWGQDLDNGKPVQTTPTFNGAKVYCGYTSCGDTVAKYTNDETISAEKPDHTQKPTFTVNEDGTHSAFYLCCGTTVTEEHDFENDAHQCVCGKMETFTVSWVLSGSLMQSTSTYGQEFTQTFTVPENTHLRIDSVYLANDASVPVNYTYENGVLTIAATDVPAADVYIDCDHNVLVTFHANGGEIIPEDGYPQEGSNDIFPEDGNYWTREWNYGSEICLINCAAVCREGYTFVDWRDASGQVHQVIPGNGNYTLATEDMTLYAQWQCNHTIGGVVFRDNGNGTHNGYCGECDELLGNYVEHPHNFGDNTHKCVCGYACPHDSYTDGVCDNCGYECAHEWGEGVLTRPTFETDGYYTYTCTLCGHSYTEPAKEADTTALNDAYLKVTEYIDNDTLTQEAKDEIYKSYRDILKNNGNVFDEFGFVRGDLVEEDQPAINAVTAELEKIVADAEEKIASGEYVKADYTEIDEAIKAIDEALENATISEEMANELSDIKSQLEALKENENTSMADAAELLERVKAVAETMADCAKGVHSFTKYEVTEEAECGKAGKEIASCDHGCGATDEKEIEALEHADKDGDLKCDHGCGYEFEQPVDPEQPDTPDTPDEPTDETCTDCGKIHTNFFSEIICFFIRVFNFIKNLFA